MFSEEEIKGNMTTIDRQLLYEIRNLLKEVVGAMKPIELENNAQISDKKVICKQCGKDFENKGLLLAHYKEHKKEGKNG